MLIARMPKKYAVHFSRSVCTSGPCPMIAIADTIPTMTTNSTIGRIRWRPARADRPREVDGVLLRHPGDQHRLVSGAYDLHVPLRAPVLVRRRRRRLAVRRDQLPRHRAALGLGLRVL